MNYSFPPSSRSRFLADLLAVALSAFAVDSFAADLPSSALEAERSRTAWAEVVESNFPFFSSVVDARKLGSPADNLTPRGIVLNLGNECWACFDTDLLRMSAVWNGKSVSPVSMSQISYHSAGAKAPEGQLKLPQIQGTPWMLNGIYPGWQAGERFSLTDPRDPGPDKNEVGRGPLTPSAGRFKTLRLTQSGIRLEYEVAGVSVSESVEARLEDGQPVVQRHFRVERVPQTLWLILGRAPSAVVGTLQVSLTSDSVGGKPAAERLEEPNGLLTVRLQASEKAVEFRVAMGSIPGVKTWETPRGASAELPPNTRWPQTVSTRGTVATGKDAYVVEDIPLPLDNPWKRNIRLADIGFFRDGRAAVVTFDGDVWMLSGLSGELKEVRWKRFTSGLHEPLSLCVRNDELFVFDRNGIWRLRDTDGNGEADAHELFSNAFAQTAETREYADGMKLAPDGSFIIAKGGIQFATLGKHNGSVLRVAPDGQSSQVIGWGLREPFIGVHPKTGLVTASDQQGNYVPATPLHLIRDGQYYGFLSNRLPKEKYPAPIADPLVWIPHPINASGATQVWLTDARMGPLNDALIHIGYYRPELFLILLNERASRLQASVLSLTRNFEFAPLSGAMSPSDGKLYVTGFQIFGSTANQISGLARLRYTGAPSTLPREVVPMDEGVLLRFDVALEAKHAIDPANFSIERWNYVRTANYGSPHFKLGGGTGQEWLTPSSAYLSKNGKSVFIGIPDMKPVMQMRVGWALAMRGGANFEQSAYFTPYELSRFDPASEGFEPMTVDLTPRTARSAAATPVNAQEGQRLAELMGCVACHSNDGSTVGKVGPTWKGLFGSERLIVGSGKAVANEAYLRESILQPTAKVVRGFEKSDTGMPSYDGVITEAQTEALIQYLKSLR
jgi:mono/diheme cytochrome c family protein